MIDWSRSERVDLRGASVPDGAIELSLARSPALRSLEGLDAPSLEKLTINGCAGLESLEGVEGAPRLRELHARGCAALRDIEPLGRLPRLEALDLAKSGVADLRPLAGLPMLREIDLSSTGPLDLAPLLAAPSLRLVVLEHAETPTRRVPRALRSRSARTRREIDAARWRPIPIVQVEHVEPDGHTAALRRLFSGGGASARQARELVRSLGPSAYAPLFAGASFGWTGDRRCVLRSPTLDEAALVALCRDAPDGCEPAARLRGAVDRLDVASELRVDDLAAFDRLEELHVRRATLLGDGAGLLGSLRVLRLDSARVHDLAWLPAAPALRRLLVFDTPLRSLGGIERAPGLEDLVLFRAGSIADSAPLEGCALAHVSLYQTFLHDVGALARIATLRTARVHDVSEQDLAPLRAAGIEVRVGS